MLLRLIRRQVLLLFVFAVMITLPLQAQVFPKKCDSKQTYKTSLQRWYCRLNSIAPLTVTFDEFKNNNVMTQSLLLKMAARTRNIEISKIPSMKKKHRDVSKKTTVAHRQSAPRKRFLPAKNVNISHVSRPKMRVQREVSPLLAGCSLQHEKILCGGHSFTLQENRPRSMLGKGALNEANRMNIDKFFGLQRYQHLNLDQILETDVNPEERQQITQYYKDAYVQYISKMLEIGLGGSVMRWLVFTKGQVGSLSPRLEMSFNHLKDQKKYLGTGRKIPLHPTLSINDCDRLNDKIVSCYISVSRIYLIDG